MGDRLSKAVNKSFRVSATSADTGQTAPSRIGTQVALQVFQQRADCLNL